MTFNYQKLPHYVGLTANYLKKYSSIYYPMPLNIHPTMGILSYPAVQQINEVEISISDTGSGIAKNDVSQIFARFFQAKQPKAG